MNPVVSPTSCRHDRFVGVDAALERVALGFEHTLVVLREHLRERADVASTTSTARRSATSEPVSSRCCVMIPRSQSTSSSSSWSMSTMSRFMRRKSVWSASHTKAKPPDMPAAKLRPVGPRITARPPVMYSQPWSPTPSTTAVAPELRTQKRSPTMPRMNTLPRGRAVEDHVAGDHVLLGDEPRACAAAAARACRPRAPCRSSRWRRPRAAA